jgi:hypothetical protein
MEQYQTNANLLLDYCARRGLSTDALAFLKYTHLPVEDVRYLTTWNSNEWMNYNGLTETEFFFNRDPADVPENLRKENEDDYDLADREPLTEDMFARQNRVAGFSYQLYANLSEADHMPEDAFRERLAVLFPAKK